MAGQSIYQLRNENKKLREMFAAQEIQNMEQHETILAKTEEYNILLDTSNETIHELKRRIGKLTHKHCEDMEQITLELREVNKEFRSIRLLRDRKIKNLENLVGVYEKRLARMAERLTDLAAERNTLYIKCREYERSWERFNEGLDQVGRGMERG